MADADDDDDDEREFVQQQSMRGAMIIIIIINCNEISKANPSFNLYSESSRPLFLSLSLAVFAVR